MIGGDAAETVLAELGTLLPGWRPIPARPDSDHADIISILEDHDGFHIVDQQRGGTESVPDPFSAAYHVTTRLFEALANSIEPRLVMHAGAVATKAGALAFAAPATTGKSTLGAAFTLAGERLLGDDRIVINIKHSSCEALPLGLAQKLRLPIPPPLAGKFDPLLARRSGRRIADSLFLKWDQNVQIPFGQALPLAKIILLVRDHSSPPRWTRPSKPNAVREILTLSATPGGSSRHLGAARALVEQVPIAILRYESCFEARAAILGDDSAVGE